MWRIGARRRRELSMTDEEMNERIVMICTGCGFTKEYRLGDFDGDHPRDACPDCGGLFLEDRKGKTPRPTAKDHGWN